MNEINRRRRFRKVILETIKWIEKEQRFKARPYTVHRMLFWVLWYLLGVNKAKLRQKVYSKNDMMDIWEIVKIIERRKTE